MDLPKRILKTGIGSLPFTDAKLAMDKVLNSGVDIPFWPQLPKRIFQEGMIAQFIEGMPALRVEGEKIVFDEAKKEDALAEFYDKFLNKDLEYFKISPDFALGLAEFIKLLEQKQIKSQFVKGQVTGLFTFAAAVTDKDQKALLHDPMMMDAFTVGISMKALHQIDLFKKFGKESIIFFDEPYMGCFGSAYTPVTKEEVIKRYGQILDNLERKAKIGIHCCGNTDWSLLLGLGIDIINFDAYDFSEKFLLYSGAIKDFLNRGGIIAWGIIPTNIEEKVSPQDLSALLKNHFDALVKKGIDLELLKSRCLITPACGLGALDENRAEEVLSLLKDFRL